MLKNAHKEATLSSSHKSCCFKLLGFHFPGSINELNTVSQGFTSTLLGTYSEKLTVHLLTSNRNIGRVITERCGNDRITIYVHMCDCFFSLHTASIVFFFWHNKKHYVTEWWGSEHQEAQQLLFLSLTFPLTHSHTQARTRKIFPSATGNRLLIHTAVLSTS